MHRAIVFDITCLGRRAMLLASLWLGLVATGPTPARGTLDGARESGKLTMGYLADAQPFSYTDASGKAAGYASLVKSCGGDAKSVATLIMTEKIEQYDGEDDNRDADGNDISHKP